MQDLWLTLPPLPPLPPLSASLLAEATEGDNPYLALYCQKMTLWSCFLLSQWGAAKAIGVS